MMMKRVILSALLSFVALMSSFAADPNLVISGVEGNYAIGSFAKGSVVFLNRTMTFGDIPEQFDGWQFTQINAYSTWNGGPSPELVAKPSADGYMYCIVDISLQTDIVDPWAEANGWNKIEGIEISYGANANQKFYAYRKACVANEEITIVEPATFSRCILIAPELTKAEPEPTYFAPDLTVSGAEGNYVIGDFSQGSTVFLNRTMTFGEIPEQFQGWKYTKINAYSTYNGGPSPELVVKPKEDGYLYCLVDISLQESIVDPWATDNGWTRINGIEISYGANANQKFYAYRKECVADEEITIVEPATFSRCIIIAPEMTEAVPVVTYEAVAIDISSKGWMETQVFENGATVFGNRAFVYHSAKAGLNGLYVIRYNGGAAPQLTVRAQADGDMYIAQCTTLTDTYDVAANGWTAVTEDDVDLRYNDGTNTPFKLYKRAVTSGETIQINSTSWAGILVFSSEEITYRILTDVTVSATQYATMVTPYTVDLEAWNTDAGITAYAVSVDETGQPTYTETTGVVPAGTPLLIQGEVGSYTIPYSYNAPEVLETELQAVTAETEADGTQYVLDYRDGELGWYKQTTGTLAAGQCFLTFPEGTDDFVPMESEIVIPDYTPSDIVICGTEGNYIIGDFAQGSVVFMNRTFTFGAIPEQFEGWKYTKIYAYSSYNGGPSPQLVATPKSDGYIYCIVDIEKQNEVVVPWAATNGWTRVDDLEIAYGANANQKFYVYRKPCVADEKISIVEPATFSRCILIAPSITESEEPVEQVDAVAVSIEARGWMEVTTLANGNTAFGNRSYTYNSVRKELSGLYVTRYNGGDAPSLLVTAQADGDLYIAQADGDNSYDVVAEGWTLVPDYTFHYNDGTNTGFTVYKRTVTEGEVVIIHTTAWQGILVLSSSAITYNLLSPIIPPVPGVVVHHSIASSKQFVGSPSIVKLNDGTLIASNDHFGSSFISNTFVSRSTDGGETWEQIAEIERLNWSKLFTRGDELYLLGVAPRVPIGYGDIVILRSNDGGETWTKPFDTEHGLLRVGYYHCAPTPVVHHNGRLWRGMENQGQDGGWGPFGAFIMSVPDSVNLLRSLNWRFTNELQYTSGAVDAFTWLEGNAVVTREGEMVDVLRLHYLPDDRAAIAHVSEDGRQFTFDPQNDISYLPGACKKFTINFDSVSNRYWTISNYVLPRFRNNDTGSTRNTLALSWSDDLVHWTIKDILLHTDEIGIRAFQYADWLIDGDDILAVVRTAWPDESGNADSPHNANYLTFHRFRNFRYENPDELEGAVEVKKWHGGAQSAMALTFDDGFKAHHDYAVPVLNNYDIPSTFFLITQEIVHQGQTPKARYGIWEDFREMADQGHEIASHTVSHPNLIGMSVEAMEQELADSRAAIEENIGQRCFSLAYPYCNHDGDVDILTAQHYEVARACGGLTNPASLTDAGRMGVNSHMVTWLYPRSLTNETTSFNALKVMTEEDLIPEGGFGVVCIHEVLPFDKLGESDTYEVATTEWLENVCQFLSEKREAGEIWPTTLSHITKYARERDNLSVKRTLNATEDTLCYDFSTRLDPTIYDEPLTLSLQVPEGWTDVRCLVMEGEMLAEEIACDPESNEVVVDVIPDRQSVIFVREIEPVGVGSVTTKKVFSYPVPAKVTAYVQFGENVEGSCQLLNMSGQVVKNLGHQHSGDGVITVPVAGLPAGMYMLRLNDGCTNRTVRILKK
ncbi:MAG: polysaccharide deacetylase family protein [Bacteroidales bacterium]|nr:polysaccharide deacetylase family protein [Bacteroidales bacterium]